MVVVGLGREVRGYQFMLELDSKMVHLATNEVQVCVLQAGDDGCGAGTGGERREATSSSWSPTARWSM